MKTVKLASRYLIPLELFLALMIVSWGIAGSLCDGNLRSALMADGQHIWWGLFLISTGLFQFVPASIEWIIGRRWDTKTLLLFLRIRSIGGFLGMSAWVYALYIVVSMPSNILPTVLIQCLSGLLFTAWSFVGNERARVVGEPNIATSNFERTIIIERQRFGQM